MAYPFLFSDNFVNLDYSMINHSLRGRAFDLDFVGRYENLVDDFDYICKKLNLDKILLPNKKGGMRKKKNYKEMYTEESVGKVKKAFSEDLNLLGYGFNQEITISKRDILIDRSIFIDNDKNINGASMIKAPDWIKNPLGKYYLYFASHSGKYIRLAYSDKIDGTYKIHKGGTLQLNQTNCRTHIASPDVHIDEDKKKILMYYHGDTDNGQKSFLTHSEDGINFELDNKVLGEFYFRVFEYKNKTYSIAKNKNEDSVIYQSDSHYGDFKEIFNILPKSRHTAVYIKDDYLFIFYTLVGDAPEQIYYCKLKLSDDIEDWDVISNHILTPPQFKFEGADSQLIPSNFGSATHRYGELSLNELRDPCIFEEDGDVYILYTFNGEAGIALGRLNHNE